MIGMKRLRSGAGGVKAAIVLCLIPLCLALGACTSTGGLGNSPSEQVTAQPPPPPPPTPTPPPVDVAGKWRLSVTGSSACSVTLGGSTGASDGSVAPAGGCPGNFFTSRKWSYENNKLVIRNHKGEVLGQLSFANGHFEGQAAGGGAVTLTR
jgi:Protease inhibitor Inh